MAGFCLPKFAADAIREKFTSGEFSPDRLADMTSAERRQAFAFMGEANAKQVNALFESKLLLKNQQLGMINWAKQILALKKETLRDTISKVERMTEVMTPKELDMFLEDLVEKKLGTHVSVEEAGALVDLARSVREAEAKIPENAKNGSPEALEYGSALATFKQYVEDMKLANESSFMEKVKTDKAAILKETAGATKSTTASLDASFIAIQGLKILTTSPVKAISIIGKVLKGIPTSLRGKDAVLPVKAYVYSRVNARNGLDTKGRLATGALKEEVFPSSLPSRIPGVGRLYQAADQAFQSWALLTRAEMFDLYIAKAKELGIDVTDKVQVEAIGSLANNLSGRAGLGRAEAVADTINVAFFSPRFWTSNVNYLTSHLLDPKATAFTKKQSAINLAKTVSAIGLVLLTAEQLGYQVEWDSNSTNFGKIKIGHSWVDTTGKLGSVVTLVSRMKSGKMKTMSGKTIDLTSDKYGALNRWDAFTSFIEGKTSPLIKVTIDAMKGRDFYGEKPTVLSTVKNLTAPMSGRGTLDILNSPDGADTLLAMILIGLNSAGFSVSTPKLNTLNFDNTRI